MGESPGATHLVELLLVPEERVVAPVLALPVLGVKEVPPLVGPAGGIDGLAGGHIGCPELVGHGVADLLEELQRHKGRGTEQGAAWPPHALPWPFLPPRAPPFQASRFIAAAPKGWAEQGKQG